MLGEASTTEIAKNKNAQGFVENQKAAKAGGNVAGNARKELEKKSGTKIVSKQNFKNLDNPKELKDNKDLR
jgi:DNA-damage-inducible protein D